MSRHRPSWNVLALAVSFTAAVTGWWAALADGGPLPWLLAIAATVALLLALLARIAVGLVFWYLLRDRNPGGRRRGTAP